MIPFRLCKLFCGLKLYCRLNLTHQLNVTEFLCASNYKSAGRGHYNIPELNNKTILIKYRCFANVKFNCDI